MATVRRRTTSVAAVALACLAVLVAVGAPAHAAAYRYWTYWTSDAGAWTFSSTGPSFRIPVDGTVEGWRFAVSTTAGDDPPRVAPAFDEICGGTAAQEGRKRIALVIDAGDTSSAPDGQVPPQPVATCVVADPDATGYDVLRSIATVRTDDGLICAIADYPAGECAPAVDATSPAPSAATLAPSEVASIAPAASGDAPGGGTPLATLAVGGILIAAVAFLLTRGRRREDRDG